jgi:hypothetical protein
MKIKKSRVLLLVALLLLVAIVLPVFAGCAKDEPETTETTETAQNAQTEEESKEAEPNKPAPQPTGSNPNAESLQSTPNKGGAWQVTSGVGSITSAYNKQLEEIQKQQDLLPTIIANNPTERRNGAEATMRNALTVLWSPMQDVRFGMDSVNSTSNILLDERVYRGIPYSNGPGNIDTLLALVNTTADNSSFLNVDMADPVNDAREESKKIGNKWIAGINNRARFGGSAVSTLLWSWAPYSTTTYAITIADMIEENGFLPVGGWKMPPLEEKEDPLDSVLSGIGGIDLKGSNLVTDGSLDKDTDDICAFNGEEVMFAAYAKAQKADALIREDNNSKLTSGEDAMMVVSVNVQMNGEKIDGEKSTVTFLRQNVEYYSVQREIGGVYAFGDVDETITFAELFHSNYIPVTCKEFNDGTPLTDSACVDLQPLDKLDKASMFKNYISCTKKVKFAQTVLKNSKGEVVYDAICFTPVQNAESTSKNNLTVHRYLFWVDDVSPTSNRTGDKFIGTKPIANKNLTVGEEYSWTLTLTFADGTSAVARELTFTA